MFLKFVYLQHLFSYNSFVCSVFPIIRLFGMSVLLMRLFAICVLMICFFVVSVSTNSFVCYVFSYITIKRMIHTFLNSQQFIRIEPPNDKTNKITFAPSKDSDQPRHPPSLVRDLAVHMK